LELFQQCLILAVVIVATAVMHPERTSVSVALFACLRLSACIQPTSRSFEMRQTSTAAAGIRKRKLQRQVNCPRFLFFFFPPGGHLHLFKYYVRRHNIMLLPRQSVLSPNAAAAATAVTSSFVAKRG
jgi:hypothetical protein